MTYSAVSATEWGLGQSVNGTGKRAKVTGAYTVNADGRPVRAFRDREGGLEAAKKWAKHLNSHCKR